MEDDDGTGNVQPQNQKSEAQKVQMFFTCHTCAKSYSTKLGLKNHIAVAHTNNFRFRCDVCNKGFYLESRKRRHEQTHKEKKKQSATEELETSKQSVDKRAKTGFPCHLCDKTYLRNRQLQNHIALIHTTELRFHCEVCDKRFDLESRKRRHEQTHKEKTAESSKKELETPEKNAKSGFSCDVCDKTYLRNRQLQNHIVLAHTHEYRFHCEFCSRGFYFESQKRTHVQTHKEKQFQCELCGKNFTLESSLKIHIKNLHEGKRYPCEICGKVIKGRSSYYSHKQVKHHQKKKYILRYSCEKCGKRFMYNSEVTRHLKLTRCGGNRDALYRCPVKGCPKVCKSIYALRYHQSTHQTKKPTCSVCFKEFAHPSGLKNHERTHDSERTMFLCHFCDTRVTTAISLKYHLRTHTGETTFKCSVCGKEFNTNAHLRQHSLVHDNVKQNVCRVCHKAFRYKQNLKAHFQKIHPGETSMIHHGAVFSTVQ